MLANLEQTTKAQFRRGDFASLCRRFCTIMALMTIFAFKGCNPAFGASMPIYTDIQYVNAIRHAEGSWTYGIKTVNCTTESTCRNICLNTVRNNKRRYKNYGYKIYQRYIQFLASRYCPTKGRNLSKSEKRLNKYWIHNTQWWLEHPKKG